MFDFWRKKEESIEYRGMTFVKRNHLWEYIPGVGAAESVNFMIVYDFEVFDKSLMGSFYESIIKPIEAFKDMAIRHLIQNEIKDDVVLYSVICNSNIQGDFILELSNNNADIIYIFNFQKGQITSFEMDD